MRFVLCAQSWHSLDDLHCHLPFDDGFCLPFGILSQKGGVHFELVEFLFSGGEYFCWLELVEFRLYLGASHCFFFIFLALAIFLLGYSC